MLRNSKYTFLFLLVFCGATYNLWRDWQANKHPFVSDASVYYCYLEAAFIKHDLTFSYPNSHWILPTPTGKYVPKMSMGLALLYMPLFLICHLITLATGGNANGYSDTYAYGMYYGALLTVLWGLWILRGLLLRWYNEKVTSLTLLALFAGTNLFYYAIGFNLLTHGFLFTLFIWLIYLTIRLYETNKTIFAALIGLVLGFCTLIRPTTALVALIPLLWGCNTIADVQLRIHWWLGKPVAILLMMMTFLLPWIPQLIYWKVQTGSYFYYTYGEEGFNFAKPQLLNVLFSYRKGWLIYTPVMLFAIFGCYTLYRNKHPLRLPLLVIFPITLYILSCWWCWWWGGAFSNRSLVEYYALLAFPMAACFNYLFSAPRFKFLLYVAGLLIVLNLLQTYQYTRNIIHWDQMTKEAYWFGFGKLKYTPDEKAEFEKLLGNYPTGIPEEYKRKRN